MVNNVRAECERERFGEREWVNTKGKHISSARGVEIACRWHRGLSHLVKLDFCIPTERGRG